MNWLVYHVISGQAFFSGVALIIAAALASLSSHGLYRRLASLAFVVGLCAIVCSSTPISYGYYALSAITTLVWVIARIKSRWRFETSMAMIAAWLIAVFIELPFHFTHSLSPALSRELTVIGDSITAGVDDNAETWPRLLARQHRLKVQDISHVGETTASAFKRIKSQQILSPIVIVEIGGNDILGSTPTAEFARGLEALLEWLEAEDRQIVMFELPLPPLAIEYGRIQRTLAVQHHVVLIPKRVLLSIIAGSASTLDSIHLTQSGHQRMADRVWQLLQPAFETEPAAM